MTAKQTILRIVYPAWMKLNKMIGRNTTTLTNKDALPPVSFYSLQATCNDGTGLNMASLQGKKVLLVNTASGCGYTAQYDGLQKLYKMYADRLVVLGFPANDFREQEKGTDEEIAAFCKANFRTTFPLMQKSIVIKGRDQNVVYQWLTDAAKNGWNNKAPSWNFSKYLVNEEGKLLNYFGPTVEPLEEQVITAIETQ